MSVTHKVEVLLPCRDSVRFVTFRVASQYGQQDDTLFR